MRALRLTPALLALALAACDPPPVVPTADHLQHQEAARIEGSVVVTGPARGDVILFLFSAEHPPPPEGTGRPSAFVVIAENALFSAHVADQANGPFTAPFTFSLVPEGRYLIRGFIDRDGCPPQLGCRAPDFVPWYSVTNEPNAGDVGGAAVDAATLAPQVVEIARGQDGQLQPAKGVTVSFAPSATVPVDRPAFTVTGDGVVDPNQPLTLLHLTATPISEGAVTEPAPTFLARFVDADHDGIPDDGNGDGVPDFYPKVIVRKLADGTPLLFENDLNNDGLIDPDGVDYPHADGKKDGQPDAVVLAAGIRPDTVIGALTHPDGSLEMGPVPLPSLDVIIKPLALDARDPEKPALLKTLPKGRYAVVIIQPTGQTWRVPNELSPGIGGALGLPELESQAFTVTVP